MSSGDLTPRASVPLPPSPMTMEEPAPLVERPLARWTVPLGVVAGVLGASAFEFASPNRWRPAQAVDNAIELGAFTVPCAFGLVLADRIAGTSRRLWAWPVAAAVAGAAASLVDVGAAAPSRIFHAVHLRFYGFAEVCCCALFGACLGLALSISARSGAGRLWKLPAAGSVAVAAGIVVLLAASHAWRWLGASDAAELLPVCIAVGGVPGLAVALGLRSRPHEPEPDR